MSFVVRVPFYSLAEYSAPIEPTTSKTIEKIIYFDNIFFHQNVRSKALRGNHLSYTGHITVKFTKSVYSCI